MREAGGLIVVDPRRSDGGPDRPTAGACTSPPVPGTDLVASPRPHAHPVAEGLADHDYLAERTTGADAVAPAPPPGGRAHRAPSPGSPATALRSLASLLADASPSRGGAGAYVLTGRGAEQSTRAPRP